MTRNHLTLAVVFTLLPVSVAGVAGAVMDWSDDDFVTATRAVALIVWLLGMWLFAYDASQAEKAHQSTWRAVFKTDWEGKNGKEKP